MENTSGVLEMTELSSSAPSVKESTATVLEQQCQQFEFIIFTIVIGSLCVFGLVGNVTSFFVLRKQKSETATIFLLQVLAVSDSILLLCSFVVYTLSSLHPASERLLEFFENCRALQIYIWPISLMAHTITIYITVLVTLNRYFAVCRMIVPNSSKIMRATKIQVVALVSFAVLYNIPRFFEHQVIEVKHFTSGNTTVSGDGQITNVTYFNLGDNKLYQILYSNVLYFPVMYIVPLVSLTCLNYRLMAALRKIREKKAALTGHRVKDDHITLVIVVIVFVFIVCQTPALANQIFWAVTEQEDRECGHFHFYYTKISDVLVVFNSTTNFVIYCLFGRSFREAFLEAICRSQFINELKKRSDRNTRAAADPSMQPLQDTCV